jgi:signal transduction histidine kinase
MAAETLKKMFNPFFTTKRGRGGTGLGMHIAYNLVVQGLGGQIEAQSQPEQGVRFRISFPAHPPA